MTESQTSLLDSRVALVTGAGRGIGRATALALVEAGARVMAVARTEAELTSLAAQAPVEYLVETVATPEGCERIVCDTRERLGPIDILVSNAGVGSAQDATVWEISDDLWREQLAVNLQGPFELTRRAVRDMIANRWGRIVIVSSTSGEHAWQSMTGYTVSKHAVTGLMRAVAQDVARYNITCNAVMPGWVRTQMSEASAKLESDRRKISVEEVWSEWAADYPAERVVTPEEVANTIVFLASDHSSGINGEAITVALGGT
jgi:NAD(P)-dependent dehydrogenase (short-subunit alcohol dehydrogenase family)